MNSNAITIRLAALVLCAPALSTAAVTLVPAAAKKGQVTYTRYCVSCHGPTAKGDGPIAPDLRVAVPDLTTMAERNGGAFPYERVVRIISSGEIVKAHGTEDMPAWGEAFKKTKGTSEQTIDAAIRNLAQYLWSLQRAK
jgi:mono/diheme cytochrome c family protein